MFKKIRSLLTLLYTWIKSTIIKLCEVQWLLSVSSALTLEYVAFSTNSGLVSDMNLKKKKNPQTCNKFDITRFNTWLSIMLLKYSSQYNIMQFSGYVSCFRGTCSSQLQVRIFVLSFSEPVVLIYHITRRHIPEQCVEI